MSTIFSICNTVGSKAALLCGLLLLSLLLPACSEDVKVKKRVLETQGILDDTFAGGAGYMTSSNLSGLTGSDQAYTGILMPNGNLLVSGGGVDPTFSSTPNHWMITPEGVLDNSYGPDSNGVVIGSVNNSSADNLYPASVWHPGSGRIYSTTKVFNGNDFDFSLRRYLGDGSQDMTLNGGTGEHVFSHTSTVNFEDYARELIVDKAGRIVAAGYSTVATGITNMVLWRFNADGSVDSSFNNGFGPGWFIDGTVSEYKIGADLALDKNGHYIVAGSYHDGTQEDVMVWRVLNTGSLDPDFGTGAPVQIPLNVSARDYARGVALDKMNRILVTGCVTGAGNDLFVLRLLPNGSLDPDFATGGIYTKDFEGVHDCGIGVQTDHLDRVLVTGYAGGNGVNIPAGEQPMLLMRLTANGTLDSTFGDPATPGEILHQPSNNSPKSSLGRRIVLNQAKGYVYVVGVTTILGQSWDMAVWRFK